MSNKRLFHLNGFSVPSTAKVVPIQAPIALFTLNEDRSFTYLGLFNSAYSVPGNIAFALKKKELRKALGNFEQIRKICSLHKQNRLIAYHVPNCDAHLLDGLTSKLAAFLETVPNAAAGRV